MVGQIFISYRHDDGAPWARLVHSSLVKHFPQNQIFMDVDNLDPGIDFVEAIEESVGSCDVLIAVIGRRWLTASDEHGKRRLDNAKDFVRLEIETALERGIRVIPILVEGAMMPRPDHLPEKLKSLARRNALEVSHDRFSSDAERLVSAVKRALEVAAAQPQRAPGKPGYLDEDRREREQKERLQSQPRERDERLEVERPPQVEQERLRDEQRLNPQSGRRQERERLETQSLAGQERARPAAERRQAEAEKRVTPPPSPPPQEHGPWPLRVGPVVLSTLLRKVDDLKQWKVLDLTDQARPRLVRIAATLALLLGIILIISAGLTFMHKPEKSFRQDTRVAGAVAELTRFVHTGNLISAEVTFRNVSPIPVKFSCDGWQLIDEQNGDRLRPLAMGGEVNPSYPETLAPGATHVAWAKFKTEAGDLFGDKYSVIIESILNRPFEGLELKPQ
jgi:hypothetical protein